MTGDPSSAPGGRFARRAKRRNQEVTQRRRPVPLLVAGGLGVTGGGGLGLYLLAAHGVIRWQHSAVPPAAAAWAGWVTIAAAVVMLLTHLVRLAQERKERQVRIEHERRAGDLMLSKVETFEQAAKAYDKFRDARAEPDGSRGDPSQEERHADPAVPETDQEALTAVNGRP
jgi:hypothetical protein